MVLRWEQLARCYTDYGRHHELDSEQRRAAFQVISKLAAGASLKKLRVDLAHLPAGALEEILAILGQTAPGSS